MAQDSSYPMNQHTAEVIRDLAMAHATPSDVPEEVAQVYALPQDFQLHYTDPSYADRFNDHPRRARGQVTLHDLPSFIAYTKRHDQVEATTVWIDLVDATAVAVVNDHAFDVEGGIGSGDPGWGDHRATFRALQTPEWNRWIAHDGRLMNQESFAELIEDGLPQIGEPDGATLLEIVQTLQGHTGAQWRSGHRLRDGRVQFGYVEEVTATAGEQGELAIPGSFMLVIAPFYGENPVPIRARFRYRLSGGKVSLGFKLDDPDLVRLNAVRAMAGRLDTEFGEGRVFRGAPR